MASTSTTTTRTSRMAWIDLIKATSVILVVLFHSVQTLAYVAAGSLASDFWTSVSIFLEPLRMPVFFVVSGMLAASAVQRGWSDTKSRTIGIAYLFLLWHTLMTMFTVAWSLLTTGGLDQTVPEIAYTYLVQIFITPGGYWYFYALVLYFVIARLLRNVNPVLVLGIAAALNLMRPTTTAFINDLLGGLGVSHMMGSVVMNAVYFLAGVYLVKYLKDIGARRDPRLLIGSGIVAIGGSALRLANPSIWGESFLWIAVAWVVFAILIAVHVAERPGAAAFASYVGPRTLPIFVIQFPVLHVMYWVLGTHGELVATNPLVQFLYPLVLTAVITVLALAAYDLAMAHRSTRWLFAAPRSWVARPVAAQLQGAPVDNREAGAPTSMADPGATRSSEVPQSREGQSDGSPERVPQGVDPTAPLPR